MARTFAVSATLEINAKQATREINKVNRAIRDMIKLSKELQRNTKRGVLGIDTRGLTKARSQVKGLVSDLNRVQSVARRPIRMTVNTSQAQSAINRLRAQASGSATMRVNAAGGGAGGLVANTARLNSSFARLYGSVMRLSGTIAGVAAVYGTAREAGRATISSDDAKTRLIQAGFTAQETETFVNMSRTVQEQYPQVAAAEVLNASVEQLMALKIAGASTKEYAAAMARIAANAQTMSVTFKDAAQGAEQARQLERFSQILGADVDNDRIRELQRAAMKAVIASGGEMTIEEAVRSMQQLGPTFARTLTPQAIIDLLLTREEGGRASTAEWRTALQDLSRDSLNPEDKAAMATLGLRRKGGGQSPAVVKAASEDLVGFVRDTMGPILKKAGLETATSAEIGAWLDENAGFTTSGARAIADLAISLREGETQRQREAAKNVNLDAFAGATSFRGATQKLLASFDTAIARNLDKLAIPFAQGIDPVSKAIDQAGKLAEQGDTAGSAKAMAAATNALITGPVGKAFGAIGAAEALKTLATSVDPFSKAVATLQLAASGLLLLASKEAPSTEIPEPVKSIQRALGLRGDDDTRRETINEHRSMIDDAIRLQQNREIFNRPRAGSEADQIRVNRAMLEQGGVPNMGEWLAMTTQQRQSILDASSQGGMSIALAMTEAGPGIGDTISAAMEARAAGMGAIIGDNAAARINNATVNVKYASADNPNTGAMNPTE